ncbi:MAG: cytochrome c biogenesis protein CcsA [Acidobacteriota bacterium]
MKINVKIILPIVLISLLTPFLSGNSDSENKISLDEFKKIVILENGRKKPLDTFAKNILKQFSGKSKLNNKSAIQWFADLLFSPEKSHEDKIFLINNPEVLTSMGIQDKGGRGRFSYHELSSTSSKLREMAIAASRIKDPKRSIVENEIIALYNKIYIYHKLLGTFYFSFPSKDFIIKNKNVKENLSLSENSENFTFFDIASKADEIKIIRSKNFDSQTDTEREILNLVNKMEQWSKFYRDQPVTIIPNIKAGKETWESPWDSLIKTFNYNKPPSAELNIISQFINAYRSHNSELFNSKIKEFRELSSKKIPGKAITGKIDMEILYNRIDPFYKSEFFYGFSLLFLLFSFIAFKKIFYYSGYILLILGLLPHTYGIIARMIIRSRPPVTNLFETFVFSAWITVLLGLALELFKKKNIGILTGSLSGLLLLIISGRYALEGDTMGMLVAVLDSNFWLATHVITITVGYGGIVISGVLGHVYVFQLIFKKGKKKELLKDTYQSVYATQAFGLIFTFIGTVLGGIWADQSWGRFWGWDPKENGALLIILWSAILFHGKLGKIFKELGFSLGSIVGIITVVLAWFGVNLLGVGLHNYGFSSNVASALTIYIILELVLITGSYIYIKQKNP